MHRGTGEKQEARAVDLRELLNDWPSPAQPGAPGSVRTIIGRDGELKIQERLELGVIQLESSGRPDGRLCHGLESSLRYHRAWLADYERRNGTSLGYELTLPEFEELRDEFELYRHRYRCLFTLALYDRAIADVDHNFGIVRLCDQYAAEECDRLALRPHLPELIVTKTQALARIEMDSGNCTDALAHVNRGVREMLTYYCTHEKPTAYDKSAEANVLDELRFELVNRVAPDPRNRLRRDLRVAVRAERFREAAAIRDEIKRRFG